MASEHRSLLMRANRLLGATLVETNLIKIEDLEKANERLLEVMASEQPRQSTVLGILAYEMKVLREEDVLHYIVENEGAGLVDLRDYEVAEDVKKNLDLGACWATWAVPFDHEEDFYFVATAYYLSTAVRTFWEKQFDGPVLWFGATLESIADYLEKLEAERASAPASGTRSPFAATTPAAAPAAGGSAAPFAKPKSATPFNAGTQSPAPRQSAAPFAKTAPAPAAPRASA